jgi:hypothetical protein
VYRDQRGVLDIRGTIPGSGTLDMGRVVDLCGALVCRRLNLYGRRRISQPLILPDTYGKWTSLNNHNVEDPFWMD